MSKQTCSSRQLPSPDQTVRESNATRVRYILRLAFVNDAYGIFHGALPQHITEKVSKRKSGHQADESFFRKAVKHHTLDFTCRRISESDARGSDSCCIFDSGSEKISGSKYILLYEGYLIRRYLIRRNLTMSMC